ncbi:tetratricopeptide repeat protein [candidate division KSB1 bacterium]
MEKTPFQKYDLDPEVVKYLEMGYKCQEDGEFELAEMYYKKSLEIEDTPEGRSFLGWNYSLMNKFEDAITECVKAIDLDPEFGKAYTDIGSYLMQMGNTDEAIPWLSKAKNTLRDWNPEIAYLVLGKIYETKGLWPLAVKEYEGALKQKPDCEEARSALDKLRANLN